MNFLAHLYLSGDDEQLKIGNFIGDFVKGNPYDRYDGKIAEGIVLHREIDRFTDTHQVSQQSKRLLTDKYRHYAGVIIDIYYDHFLAANWDQYSNVELSQFAMDSYRLMEDNIKSLPAGAKRMLPFMKSGDWLTNYANFSGIQSTLSGMSRRTSFDSRMDEAVTDLKRHYTQFESDFFVFFEEILKHVSKLRNGDT